MTFSKESAPPSGYRYLIRVGTSLALVIPKPLLQLLRLDKNTPLILSTNGIALTLTPDFEAAAQRPIRSPRSMAKELENIMADSFEMFEEFYRTQYDI